MSVGPNRIETRVDVDVRVCAQLRRNQSITFSSARNSPGTFHLPPALQVKAGGSLLCPSHPSGSRRTPHPPATAPPGRLTPTGGFFSFPNILSPGIRMSPLLQIPARMSPAQEAHSNCLPPFFLNISPGYFSLSGVVFHLLVLSMISPPPYCKFSERFFFLCFVHCCNPSAQNSDYLLNE